MQRIAHVCSHAYFACMCEVPHVVYFIYRLASTPIYMCTYTFMYRWEMKMYKRRCVWWDVKIQHIFICVLPFSCTLLLVLFLRKPFHTSGWCEHSKISSMCFMSWFCQKYYVCLHGNLFFENAKSKCMPEKSIFVCMFICTHFLFSRENEYVICKRLFQAYRRLAHT